MTDYSKIALQKHKELKGKIAITPKDLLDSKEKMSIYYTPGVGAVSSFIADNPSEARDYTWINNSVAVVSDGSAVLGLGNIGPRAALPVMEGKCMIFKHFGGVDAVPIVINEHTTDGIVSVVKAIAPSFGGINLEDIAAPICFEVEDRLKKELQIPVMHDDQHGTAVVALAAIINACKVTDRSLHDCKIVLLGSGAAGVAIAKLIHNYANPEIIAVDSKGIISEKRSDLTSVKRNLLQFTNPKNVRGALADAIKTADIFIGVSVANLLSEDMVRSMAKNPIIIALANPVPEIMPDVAKRAGAAVIATGRSDFPNQVNNSLAFPGIFRGALDNRITQLTEKHKLAAAETLAALVKHPSPDHIIPDPFEVDVAKAIAKVII